MSDFKPDFGTELSRYVGQQNSDTTRDLIKEQLTKVLGESPNVAGFEIPQCEILWDIMSLRGKLKWFAFNRFPFKKRGELERKVLYLQHQNEMLLWKLSNPNADYSDFPQRFELPLHLEPSPRSVVVVKANLKLVNPVNFVEVKVELP